jgi:hypothetical protein
LKCLSGSLLQHECHNSQSSLAGLRPQVVGTSAGLPENRHSRSEGRLHPRGVGQETNVAVPEEFIPTTLISGVVKSQRPGVRVRAGFHAVTLITWLSCAGPALGGGEPFSGRRDLGDVFHHAFCGAQAATHRAELRANHLIAMGHGKLELFFDLFHRRLPRHARASARRIAGELHPNLSPAIAAFEASGFGGQGISLIHATWSRKRARPIFEISSLTANRWQCLACLPLPHGQGR